MSINEKIRSLKWITGFAQNEIPLSQTGSLGKTLLPRTLQTHYNSNHQKFNLSIAYLLKIQQLNSKPCLCDKELDTIKCCDIIELIDTRSILDVKIEVSMMTVLHILITSQCQPWSEYVFLIYCIVFWEFFSLWVLIVRFRSPN